MRHLLVTIDNANAPDVAHVVTEHYLGYDTDSADAPGIEVVDLICEGWWHHNTNAGRVHDHPEHPGRGWSTTSHRLCLPVYVPAHR